MNRVNLTYVVAIDFPDKFSVEGPRCGSCKESVAETIRKPKSITVLIFNGTAIYK